MCKKRNDNPRGSVCQLDERVNCILLIMFVAVLSILTAKGCSDTDKNADALPKVSTELTDSIVTNDNPMADSTTFIHF